MTAMGEEMRRELEQLERETAERQAREERRRAAEEERRARSKRQSVQTVDQHSAPSAGRVSRTHSVIGESPVPQEMHVDDRAHEMRGRISEATYATSQATQYFSMAQEPEVGSGMHAKMLSAMTRPKLFDGTRPSSWISHMEYYMDSAGVFGEVARLRVAVSFLDFERMDWFTVALGESQRPQSWTEMKEVILSHFNAISETEAVERARRVRQGGAVQEYLSRFNKAVAECPNLLEEEKTKMFVANLKPEISDLVDVRRPRNMKEPIAEAVRIGAKQAERARERRGVRGEPPPAAAKGPRAEGRGGPGGNVQAGPRHMGYGGYLGGSYGGLQSGRPHGRVEAGPSAFPTYPAGRGVQGTGARPPRPALMRETGLRSGPRRSAGVQFTEDSGANAGEKSTIKCFECGQEGHYRANCPKRAGN